MNNNAIRMSESCIEKRAIVSKNLMKHDTTFPILLSNKHKLTFFHGKVVSACIVFGIMNILLVLANTLYFDRGKEQLHLFSWLCTRV